MTLPRYRRNPKTLEQYAERAKYESIDKIGIVMTPIKKQERTNKSTISTKTIFAIAKSIKPLAICTFTDEIYQDLPNPKNYLNRDSTSFAIESASYLKQEGFDTSVNKFPIPEAYKLLSMCEKFIKVNLDFRNCSKRIEEIENILDS
jgi:hypothetical protein